MRLLALLLLLLAGAPAGAQHLVIVGGGPRPPDVMARIAALAGGAEGYLVVIPYASEEPEETGAFQAAQFDTLGVGRTAVAGPSATAALLEGATGVFFSGGDQRRLAARLLGTPLLEAVRAVYARGGVVAGTSAGAAVMSRVMITGDERVSPDSARAPFSTVEPGNVALAEGFGLLDDALGRPVVVDQHFVVRKRQNRLLSVTAEYPHLLGLGIDEETALVARPDGALEVVGNRGVQVFDASEACVAARGRGFSARGVRLHLLAPGDVVRPEALAPGVPGCLPMRSGLP
ncbi:MAG: cyanophycinase [Rubricoccaceae bacterium]